MCTDVRLEERSLTAPDNCSSLLRELFETAGESSEHEISAYPKPQLSTVSVSYIGHEVSGSAPRLDTPGALTGFTRRRLFSEIT